MKRLQAFALLVALALTSTFTSLGHTQTAYPGDGTTANGIASWRITNTAGSAICRYYAIDNELGNDARVGYYDATVGSTFTTELTTRAIKTFERLREIMPRWGNGRCAVVLAKARSDLANFLKKDAATSDWLDIGYSGYQYIAFRGSDLTNGTNDRVDLGGVVGSAGPNGDSSWTATGQAGFVITNGAGTLGTQDAIAGMKLRYSGNVTASLRTKSNTVLARTAATTLEVAVGTGFFTVANGDTYFINTPGVKVTKIVSLFPAANGPSGVASTGTGSILVAGFRFTAAIVGPSGSGAPSAGYQMIFCRTDAAFNADGKSATFSVPSTLVTEAYSGILTFSGLDARAAATIIGGPNQQVAYSAFHAAVTFAYSDNQSALFYASYSLLAPTFYSVGNSAYYLGNGLVLGSTALTIVRRSKAVAGITLNGAKAQIAGIDFDGATNGIVVNGAFNELQIGANSEGPIGTASVSAIDISAAKRSQIVNNTNVTVGTTQDLLMSGSVTATFASLATSPQYDAAGNVAQGSAGTPVKRTVLKFSGAHIGGAGAAVSYMADGGTLAAGAIAVVQNYPVPAMRVRNLAFQCKTNALGANMTATFYKNGASCNVIITDTTGSTALFTDTTHECQYAAGDLMDLRLDSNAAGVATALCTATAEAY